MGRRSKYKVQNEPRMKRAYAARQYLCQKPNDSEGRKLRATTAVQALRRLTRSDAPKREIRRELNELCNYFEKMVDLLHGLEDALSGARGSAFRTKESYRCEVEHLTQYAGTLFLRSEKNASEVARLNEELQTLRSWFNIGALEIGSRFDGL